MANVDTNIQVGTVFDSFSALEEEINKFQKENSVQFYSIRDSRKIEAAKRRAPNRNFNTDRFGGKAFKSESNKPIVSLPGYFGG